MYRLLFLFYLDIPLFPETTPEAEAKEFITKHGSVNLTIRAISF